MKPKSGLGDQDASGALARLDARSREIFRQLVESYLDSGEPVGSRNLSRTLSISLSPASVRNVMSDLEELGLIYAPHTSAGRLPTDSGLRLFVDAMLEVRDLGPDDRRAIDSEVRASAEAQSTENLLSEAGALLSDLSRGAGLVLAGNTDARLKQIEFLKLEPRRVLVVLVATDGTVENRLMDLADDVPPSALVEAANYLNAQIHDRTLADARAEITRRADRIRAELDTLTQKVVTAGLATWAGVEDNRPPTLIVRGQANLLEDLSAAEDLERIRVLFEDLERKTEIAKLLGDAETAEGVRIFIGSETKLFSMSGSSLIVAPYRDAERRIVGALGVIGPTRLNYGRIVPMVDYTAQLVGRLLR